MAVSSIYNQYRNQYGIQNDYTLNFNSGSASGSTTLGKTARESLGGSLGAALLSSQGQGALTRAIKELKAAGYSRVTYDDINDYRQTLEKKFSDTVRSDLKELGVDEKVQFSLVSGSDGSVKVVCSNAEEKAKIEKYLQDNPDMVKDFQYIQALSNFKRTAESPQVRDWPGMTQMKKTLQAQAVQAFFSMSESANMPWSSQIANFSTGGGLAEFFLGLNQRV